MPSTARYIRNSDEIRYMLQKMPELAREKRISQMIRGLIMLRTRISTTNIEVNKDTGVLFNK